MIYDGYDYYNISLNLLLNDFQNKVNHLKIRNHLKKKVKTNRLGEIQE